LRQNSKNKYTLSEEKPMKQFCFFLLIVGTAYSGCSSVNHNYDKLYGFWGIEINDASGNQKFVVCFSKGEKDIECQFHSYFNGIKFSSEIGSEINFDGEHLSIIANQSANVRYEGKVDTINGIIIGKLKYADGTEREFDLKKVSNESRICYNITKGLGFTLNDFLNFKGLLKKDIKPDMISLRSSLVSKKFILICHEFKIKALAWDFISYKNAISKIKSLVDLGIDGILFDNYKNIQIIKRLFCTN
ncbi:MAG: hypothetical protein R3255_08165, partial [Candidatus Lokiarchaeia archaeon]|nr:hypothetical protein [Candidatus Lokiarchaeia archaeon]